MKLNSATLFVLLIFPFNTIFGQNFEWAKSLGSYSNWDVSRSIVTDSIGNVYTTGYFHGSADFDPGNGTFILQTTANYDDDAFISKLDSNGNFVWALSLGQTSNRERGEDITLDTKGNILTIGRFSFHGHFNPDSTSIRMNSNGGRDVFISKLNKNGHFVWSKNLGGMDSDEGNAVATDKEDNVYVTGSFRSSGDFDPGNNTLTLTSNGGTDIFITKLDSNGTLIWSKSIGGQNNESGYSIATDNQGNCYISGTFSSIVDFDPGPATFYLGNATTDDGIFLIKLDPSGNLIWAKNLGSTRYSSTLSNPVGKSVKIGNNRVYVSGTFYDTIDVNPNQRVNNLISNGDNDAFLTALDTAGNFLWSRSWGGSQADKALSMDINNKGEVLVTGFFEDSVDFDPGNNNFYMNTTNQIKGSFIVKYDSTGSFIKALQLGKGSYTYATGISVDLSNNIITTGYYRGTADFDPSPANNSLTTNYWTSSIFVTKLRHCSNFFIKEDTINSCRSYRWRDNNLYSSTTNSPIFNKYSLYGCDTLFHLNLEITKIDTGIIQVNDSLIAIDSLANYQWINCNTLQAVNGANSRYFKPTNSGRYSVILSKNNCSDTSDCFNYLTTDLQDFNRRVYFSIYPNPSNGNFTVKLENHISKGTLKLSTLTGKVVLSKPLEGQNQVLIDEELANGIYVLSIEDGKSSLYRKIVVH